MCTKSLSSGENTQRQVSTHDAVQRHLSYGSMNLMMPYGVIGQSVLKRVEITQTGNLDSFTTHTVTIKVKIFAQFNITCYLGNMQECCSYLSSTVMLPR